MNAILLDADWLERVARQLHERHFTAAELEWFVQRLPECIVQAALQRSEKAVPLFRQIEDDEAVFPDSNKLREDAVRKAYSDGRAEGSGLYRDLAQSFRKSIPENQLIWSEPIREILDAMQVDAPDTAECLIRILPQALRRRP